MRTIILSLLIILVPILSNAWGKDGHQIIAKIAYDHLTPIAKQNLKKVLGSTSIEDASVWMDEQRGDREYDYMKPWHYINIEKDQLYDSTSKNNIIYALTNVAIDGLHLHGHYPIDIVKRKTMILIHLMGDLMQPLHVGYGSDKGGNMMQVQFDGRGTNLHQVWDTEIIRSQNITAESCYAFIEHLRPGQIDTVQNASFEKLMEISRKNLPDVYDFSGHVLTEEYPRKNKIVVECQLIYAGLKLSAVLNELFEHDYSMD